MTTQTHTKVAEAIELLGGPTSAARVLANFFPDRDPLTGPAVKHWITRGIPPEYCIPLEKALNGRVMRHELRPDIYPPAEYGGAAA